MGYAKANGQYVYETYGQEQCRLFPNRPWKGRPTWELRNMKKALSMMTWSNTEEETQRLAEVTAELAQR